MKSICQTLLPGLMALVLSSAAVAGTTGKIAGRVTDAATGEGLPGANVTVEGTTLGAATDGNGHFIILNLPPGNFTLRASMIGYGKTRVEGLRVFVDRTTTQDFALKTETIEGEEVVIEAVRPLVERDRTSTAAYVDAETIKDLPVQEVSEVIQLQAGVVAGSGGELHFRGGRQREVAYLIDGVAVSDAFSQGGGSNVAIENSIIEELQVITGTFTAEYGDAQSAIVNVVTKRPAEQFHGEVQVFAGDNLSDRTDRFIGISDFDPLGEKDVQGTISGPLLGSKLGYFATARYHESTGHLFGERRYNPTDGWIIDAYRRWYTERFSGQIAEEGRISIPDSLKTGDGALVPLGEGHKLTFSGKLTYVPVPSLSFNYSLFFALSEGQGYSNSWRYAPDGRTTGFGKSHQHFISLRHNPTPTLFYNLRASYQYNHSKSYLREDITIADYPGDDGYLPLGASDGQTGFVQGDNQWGRGFTERKQYMANGDVNWQVDRHNFVKLGFEVRKHDIHFHNQPLVETTPWKSTKYTSAISGKGLEFNEYLALMTEYWKHWSSIYGTSKLREANHTDGSYVDYTRQPIEVAAYVQDKVELGELVFNAGVRLDLFDARAQTLINKRALSEQLGVESNLTKTKIKSQLSPRIGFSFPISDRGAFHVSYGHFFQMPSFSKLFERPVDEQLTSLLLSGARLGDPNLKPERTISYEVGLQQQVSTDYALDVTMFFKDIRDQLGIESVRTPDAVGYTRYINRDYGNVKGLTLALEKLRTGLLSGTVDYTFQYARGSASDPNFLQLIEVATRLSGEPIQFPERQILPLDWDQRHTINLTLNLVRPGDWAVSVIGSWGSGLPYSPSSVEQLQLPDREFKNSARKPVRYDLDLKANKAFEIGGLSYSVFLRVYNLLDHLNQNYVYSTTGTANETARLPTDERTLRRALEQAGQFTMSEWDNKPHWFSSPRRVQLGLTVAF